MTVVDLYTVQIIRDVPAIHTTTLLSGTLSKQIAETEENLTDLLPPGYRARIRRWDHADEGEQSVEAAADPPGYNKFVSEY